MNINQIYTVAEYESALRKVEHYFDNEPPPGSPSGDHFEALVKMIENYESIHHPITDV
ncbi:hypothetical protein ACXX82_00235 [Glaciimonas sp. GNP009]